jgi:hypothetical protein
MTERELVEVIEAAAQGGSWNAAAWLLERRWPERWNRSAQRAAEERGEPQDESAEDPFGRVVALAEARKR